jgi:hypothetical protein
VTTARLVNGRLAAAALVLALGVAAALPSSTAGAARPGAGPRVRRVLVLALPAVSWADLDRVRVPNLDALLARSAVGDLSTRSAGGRTSEGAGYLTLGAGARAEGAPAADGLAFEPGERFGNGSAGAAYERRTGRDAGSSIAVLGVPQLADINRKRLFDARVGALGDALERAGVARAVIANADRVEPGPVANRYHREAALALTDRSGRVPAGRVSEALVTADAAAPFGVRTDLDAVVRAFDATFRGRAVVLVEAPDLARVDAYRPLTTPAQHAAFLHEALQRTDELVARMLDRVDLRKDAVLVVGPAPTTQRVELTVAALHAPGVRTGLLRSATTRRSGFVTIVDVAPTILDLVGGRAPTTMEGRPFEVGASGGSAADRRSFLVDADSAAHFRDSALARVTLAFVAFSILLAVATLLLVRRERARPVLRWCALGLLGFLVATFIAGFLPFFRWGLLAYWTFLVGGGVAFAALCALAGRGHRLGPLAVALGGVVALHVGDALTGAHLELDTVFGYSPTVGIRLAGLGNLAYAELAAAVVLLAGLVAFALGSRRGPGAAVALLATVLVVVAAPLWGQNFGGALAAAPAFLLVALLLYGRRMGPRSAVLLAGVLLVTGAAIGLVDLLRPSGSRTHVGRFFEKVQADGWHGFAVVVHRKLNEELATFTRSWWTVMVIALLVFVAFLAWRAPSTLSGVMARVPPLRAAVTGLVLLGVLGLALKDSGIAVPGMMLGVVGAGLVWLTARLEPL